MTDYVHCDRCDAQIEAEAFGRERHATITVVAGRDTAGAGGVDEYHLCDECAYDLQQALRAGGEGVLCDG